MKVVYGAGLKDGTCEFCFDGDGVPDDYRTEWRYNFPFDEDVNSFGVDTRVQLNFATGPLDHSLLAGVDYRKYDNDQSFGFGLAPPIDRFNPVYGAAIVTPAMNPYVDQVQEQTGFYVQDQIKWDRLIVTLSGRQDSVDNDNFGTETDDDEFTYRAGVNTCPEPNCAVLPKATLSSRNCALPAPRIRAGNRRTGRGWHQVGRRNLDRATSSLPRAVYKIKQDKVLIRIGSRIRSPRSRLRRGRQGRRARTRRTLRERLSMNASYTYTDTDPQLFMVARPRFPASWTIRSRMAPWPGSARATATDDRNNNIFADESLTLWDAILHYDTKSWRMAINGTTSRTRAQCTTTANCFYGEKRVVIGSVTYKF
jgi:iron complex outermembrane receptor protein